MFYIFLQLFPSFDNSDYFESESESSEEDAYLNQKQKQYKNKVDISCYFYSISVLLFETSSYRESNEFSKA